MEKLMSAVRGLGVSSEGSENSVTGNIDELFDLHNNDIDNKLFSQENVDKLVEFIMTSNNPKLVPVLDFLHTNKYKFEAVLKESTCDEIVEWYLDHMKHVSDLPAGYLELIQLSNKPPPMNMCDEVIQFLLFMGAFSIFMWFFKNFCDVFCVGINSLGVGTPRSLPF